MKSYPESEKLIFEHLYQKYQDDPSQTFSVRQKAGKGAETDYFIGTQKSNYLSFTLWEVHVYYSGASGDLISYLVFFHEDHYRLKLEFNMSRAPDGEQNEANLELLQRLEKKFAGITMPEYELGHSTPGNKMHTFYIQPKKKTFTTIDDLLKALDALILFSKPLITEAIEALRSDRPQWNAQEIIPQTFEDWLSRMERRFKKYENRESADPETEPEPAEPPRQVQSSPALNLILYGPPGTGKTYHTKNIAVGIVEGLSPRGVSAKYPERLLINERFQHHLENGQIAFVSFHQSFSYEDFIEGIKPILPTQSDRATAESTPGELGYEIIDGVFKTMANRAASYQSYIDEQSAVSFDSLKDIELNQAQFFKMSLGNSTLSEDDLIYRYCLRENCIALGWGQDVDYSEVKTDSDLRQIYEAKDLVPESSYELTALKCFLVWMQKGDVVFIAEGTTKIRAIGLIDGDYYYQDNSSIRYKHFRPVRWLVKDVQIPVNEVYKKRLSQQTIYQMYTHLVNKAFFRASSESKARLKNHVLIIDEINRGNIANIFGELITLLEADKRAGAREELTTLLPYSKEPFTVPANLYIIGTMNTADRSVEALDSALRRRFTFQAVYPRPNLLAPFNESFEEALDLGQLLTTINDRIEFLLNRDHCIGHSYFMALEDKDPGEALPILRTIFNEKIIPLLQEYFYGDHEKIGMVLGEDFIRPKAYAAGTSRVNFGKGFRSTRYNFGEKKVLEFTEPDSWTLASFRSIYEAS